MRKESEQCCFICSTTSFYYSIFECNHIGGCHICTYKSRTFYNDLKCPVCNVINKEVIIFEVSDTKISYSMHNKTNCYKDYKFNSNGIYFSEVSAMEEIAEKTRFKCPIAHCKEHCFEELSNLNYHLRNKHKRYYCEVCLQGSKRFLGDATVFTYDYLQEHFEYGEYDQNFQQLAPSHPFCIFCEIKLFNEEALLSHMNKEHYECQVCKSHGKSYIYYRDIRSIHLHNKFKHHQCPMPECLNDFFVVFESKQKLLDHLNYKHKCIGKQADDKISAHNKDNTDPFDQFKKITNYRDEQFDVDDLMKNMKIKMEKYVQNKKELALLNKPKEVIVSTYNNYGGGNKKQNFKEDYNAKSFKVVMKEYGNDNFEFSNAKILNSFSQPKVPEKPKLKIDDYPSYFNEYYNILKKYITDKIKQEEIEENKVRIPIEVGYQLTVLIDKNSNEENSELKFIVNFGFGLSLVDELLHCFARTKNYDLYQTLDRIPFNKVLILYKYFNICNLKVTGCFFRKGIFLK